MNTYRSYRNLPSLAGICTMNEAMKQGLSIEECVARLKRYHYALKRLRQIFNNRITSEPIYELKMGFSLHAHCCAEHVAALRKRVGEMREPPLGLEEVPHVALEIFFDEILSAPSTEDLLLGLYEKALPAVKAALTNTSATRTRWPTSRRCVSAVSPCWRLRRCFGLELNASPAWWTTMRVTMRRNGWRYSMNAWAPRMGWTAPKRPPQTRGRPFANIPRSPTGSTPCRSATSVSPSLQHGRQCGGVPL
jgi:hypothetical protein